VPVETALRDAKLSLDEINEVVLVGGSTRIPAVVKLVNELTKKQPNQTVRPSIPWTRMATGN
jgi:molecular chaperone DnaK (HSP70)